MAIPLRYHQAATFAILEGEHDPENTVFVSLTVQELAIVAYGVLKVFDDCLDVRKQARELNDKLTEITKAQNFLSWPEQE